MHILQFLIEVSGITTALIFIARFVIKWIGDAGLERYKNELQKETLKFQSNLDKDLEKFKIKYYRLHIEQVEIIKKLYSKLIKAEKPLEYLMRPIKLNPDKSDNELSKDVVQNANEFFDYFDENEVIFNEETCKIIKLIKEKYIAVWNTYYAKQFVGETISGELLSKLVKDMRVAYDDILNGEIQKLKKELKEDFRIKLGIIENSNR
jgi:hypothetical protein